MNLNSNVFIFSIVWFMMPVLLQPLMWHIVKMATQTNLQNTLAEELSLQKKILLLKLWRKKYIKYKTLGLC